MKRNINLRKKSLAIAVSTALPMLAGAGGNTAYAQGDVEEVLVTGSRIVRRDLSAPSPIVTVGAESFDNSATTSVESVLNQLPQFVPGNTQFTSSVQNSATNTPGAATLNLRGLGANRNLVLIDGKRAQPVNATMVVDINTIPASAIQNVEIITGGASAVYGPDAMAGVVNFMLKDDFEGLDVDYQIGNTAEGDGQERRFSVLMGTNSADGRGNIMVGIDRTEREGVLQRERDFYINGWNDTGNPGGDFIMPAAFAGNANSNPASQAAIDALFPQVAPGTIGTASDIYFNADGSPFVVQGALGYNGPLNCLDCGDYTLMKVLDNGNLDQRGRSINLNLSSPLDRTSVFARGNYSITDRISVFTQMNYSTIEVKQSGNVPPAITVWQAPAVPRDGRALPADLETLLDSRTDPTAPWPLFHVLSYNGNIQATNNNDVWQFMVGLEGEFNDGDMTWELYASSGDTSIEAINNRLPSLQRYQELVYAPNFGQVQGYTPGTVNGVGTGRGYVLSCDTGLPVFDKFPVAQNCLDSIDTQLVNRSNLTQDIVEFNLQGGAGFELPGGEARFAVGATERENSFQFTPGNPVVQLRDNPIGVFANNGTGGEISVTEIYGELLLPVVDSLDLELGARYSDFSTAGGQETYKGLFTFRALDNLTFRGGWQVANRAPNIAELFTAPTQEVVGHPDQDPCSVTTLSPWGNVPGNPDRQQVIDLCRDIIGNATSGFDTQTYSITGIPGPEGFHRQNPPFFPLEIALRQGNPGVGPEEGDTFTFGAVISPTDSLTLTIDYYDIELTNAIFPLLVSTVYDNCFNFNGVSNPSYDINNSWCQMIRRNPFTGDREEVDTPFFNLGTTTTQGVDLSINWIKDFGPGTFAFNSNMNFLDSFEYQTAPGGRTIDATGTLDQGGLFEFQALSRVDYAWNNVNLGLSWRHLDSAKSAAAAQSPTTTIQGPGSYDVFSLNGGVVVGDRYNLRFGIDNLFDADPEFTNANPAGGDTNTDQTNAALYDLLGRRFYIGMKISF